MQVITERNHVKSSFRDNEIVTKLGLTAGAIPELKCISKSENDVPPLRLKPPRRPKIFASLDTMHKLIEKVNSSIDIQVKEKIEKENSRISRELEQEQQRLSRKRHKEELVVSIY